MMSLCGGVMVECELIVFLESFFFVVVLEWRLCDLWSGEWRGIIGMFE